jgi:hypothetical protein
MAAFRQDYEVNSSSMYRVVETVFRGYGHLEALPGRDACLEARMEQFRRRTLEYGTILPLVTRYAVNETERQRATSLDRQISELFGRPAVQERLRRIAIQVLALRWKLRCRLLGDRIQPSTIVTRYGLGSKKAATIWRKTAPSPKAIGTLASYLPQPFRKWTHQVRFLMLSAFRRPRPSI